MKIACFTIYPASAPSVYHRVSAYHELFAQHGTELSVHSFMSEYFYSVRKDFGPIASMRKIMLFCWSILMLVIKILAIRRYDMVIVHREVFPLGPPLVEKWIARLSRRCVYDLDDAIWHPPSFEVNQRGAFWYADRVKEIVEAVDCVVIGNNYLREYALQFREKVVRIPTGYDDLGGPVPNSPVDVLPVIVWIGNIGNAEYLDLVTPALKELAKTHDFVLRLIGGSDLQQIEVDGVNVEIVRWHRHLERDLLKSSSIGIMPLYDKDYEQGKCSFKIVQYFSAGLPVVASPIGMNCEIVLPGQNGFLASSTDEWKASLLELLDSGERRHQMGVQAYQKFTNEYSREKIMQQWLGVVDSFNH